MSMKKWYHDHWIIVIGLILWVIVIILVLVHVIFDIPFQPDLGSPNATG